MAVLACLHPDPRARARLTEALWNEHALLPCPGWERLWELVHTHRLDGCVLDLPENLEEGGASFERNLRRLREMRPGIAVVVYRDFTGREMDLFHLGRARVDGILFAGRVDGGAEIRRGIESALDTALADWVTQRLDGRLDAMALAALRWAVEHARVAPSVEELATALGGTSSRAINRHLARAAMPTATQILLWGRLLRAARMLEEEGANQERTAYKLRYSSASALRRTIRRHLGVGVGELVEGGGPDLVIRVLLRRIPGGPSSRPSRARWSSLPSTAAGFRRGNE